MAWRRRSDANEIRASGNARRARSASSPALGLKAAIMLLNPARIVIGGGIAKAGDALFVPLREELRRQITAWSRARIDVVPAALGDDSVLWGGLRLALYETQRPDP